MADLKTIDAQMDSPCPKTAIIKECLRSIKESLDGQAQSDRFAKISELLGE
jgi:hypothetical protein